MKLRNIRTLLVVLLFAILGGWLLSIPDVSSAARPPYHGPNSLPGYMFVLAMSGTAFCLAVVAAKRKVPLWVLALGAVGLCLGGVLMR